MRTSSNKNRETWIDICRGVGILLVVLGHCNIPFVMYKMIYSFHMPFFFILSGYLFKNKKAIKEYGKKLWKRYIIPYFFLCMINFMIMAFLKPENNFGKYIIGILYSRGTTEWMPNCSPLWFLTAITVALFLFNIILYKNNVWGGVLVATAGTLSYLLYLFQIPKLPWNIDTAWMAIVFLFLGYQLYRYQDVLFQVNLSCCFGIGVLGLLAAYANPVAVNFNNNEYGNLFLMLIAAGGISFCLIRVIQKYQPCAAIFGFYGKHTLFIMGFDYFSNLVSLKFVQNFCLQFFLKMIILTIGIICYCKLSDRVMLRKQQNERNRKIK